MTTSSSTISLTGLYASAPDPTSALGRASALGKYVKHLPDCPASAKEGTLCACGLDTACDRLVASIGYLKDERDKYQRALHGRIDARPAALLFVVPVAVVVTAIMFGASVGIAYRIARLIGGF